MNTRILVASGVRHAADYVDLLRGTPDVQLVGIAEADDAPAGAREDGERLAAEAGVPFRSLAEGLAACDAVVVCSEPTRHAALAVQALDAGRSVLVDKPAGVTAQEAEALEAAAALAPQAVLTAVHRLLSPAVVRARASIDAGGIGLPLGVHAEWIASGGLDGTTVERPELVCDPALSGGGELMNFGWYPLLALGHLTGLQVLEVTAFGGALFDGPHAGFGVEDSAVLSLLLERGVSATVTVARVPAGVSDEPVSSIVRVLGSHGHLVVDEAAPAIRVRSTGDAAPSRRTIGGSAGGAALRACFAEFLAAVRGEGTVTLGPADITRVLRVLDAARASIATGFPVRVSPSSATAGAPTTERTAP
jgi:predicted dehydrogenase